jgi:hypothetical protein
MVPHTGWLDRNSERTLMFAVYLCGCTDCFLTAMFRDEKEAYKWARENSKNPEGFRVAYWRTPEEIDRNDTGWEG